MKRDTRRRRAPVRGLRPALALLFSALLASAGGAAARTATVTKAALNRALLIAGAAASVCLAAGAVSDAGGGVRAGVGLKVALVRDINPGPSSASVSNMTAVGDRAFFVADDGVHGEELWSSDGTAAGTALVADIRPGSSLSCANSGNLAKPCGSNIRGLVAGVGVVFFSADDGVHGMELWKSDGTAAGTSLVEDISPGLDMNGRPAGSNPVLLGVLNGRLLFGVGYGTPGGLWTSDGTEAGTRRVSDVNPVGFAQLGGGPLPLGDAVELKGRLFFGGGTATVGGLFASDGTAAGTTLVREIRSSGDNPDPDFTDMTLFRGKVYFQAEGSGRGHELWSSDGTTAGTRLVKDIYVGRRHSYPDRLTVVGERLFFEAEDRKHGRELWTSDGTTAGTRLVKDINARPPLPPADVDSGLSDSDPTALTALATRLFFVASDARNHTWLWRSNGSDRGTTKIKRLPKIDGCSGGLATLGAALFFRAFDGHGCELWRTDGTPGGTVRTTDINPGRASSSPRGLLAVADRLFFVATDKAHGTELWSLAAQ